MLLKFRIWKNNLSPAKQLFVSFVVYWIYWLVAWLIFEKLYNKGFHSATYHIMHATWMSGFWMIFQKWKLIKQVLKTRKKSNF